MSWFEDSNIKKSYIVQTVSDVGIFSACTQIYLTNISPCAGDTINITGNLGVSGNISGTTYFGDGSQLSGIVTTDNFVTGGVYSASSETLYFTGTTGFTPFSVDVSALLDNTNNFVTGGTYNSSTDIVTLTRNDNVNINITGVSNTFTTGATYNEGTELITFVRNDGNSYTADLAAIVSATTNSFTTGATLNGNIIEFANSVLGLNYYNVDLTPIVSGATNGYTTGATLNGNIIEFANNLFGLDYYNVDLTSLVSGFTTGNTLQEVLDNGATYVGDNNLLITHSGATDETLLGKSDGSFLFRIKETGDTKSQIAIDKDNFRIDYSDPSEYDFDGNSWSMASYNTILESGEQGLNFTHAPFGGGGTRGIDFREGDSIIITDSFSGTAGVVYAQDYSSTYSNRSLVDKGYVDGVVSGKVDTTLFNTYSGSVQTDLDTKLPTTTFNSYTGSVVDVFVSSGNANAGTQQLSFTNTTGGTFNVTNSAALFSDNDINVTGGTYDTNTGCVTFITNSGTTFDVCGFVTGITDTFVTGGTLTGENLVLERSSGVDVGNIDLSGLVSGKLEISLFNTYTGDTQTALGTKTDNINFVSHTGDTTIHYTKGSINLSELGSSAHTHSISEVVNLQTELDAKVETTLFNTYTGDTETALGTKTTNTNFTSHTGDTTIHYTKGSINLSDLGSSAHTHSISEVINLQNNLDAKVATTLFNTYTGDTETALGNKLATTTFNSYTGSVVDVFVSSGNANAGTQQLSFTNTTGGTFNVTNSAALFSDNDVNVTGGTYNASTGCVTFTTNSGTTFDVCGFVTGITDTFVTGYTYSDNTFTLTRNQGLSDLTSTINTMTGLTVNGVLSATTYTGITLDGIDDVTTGIPTTPGNEYQGRQIYFDVASNEWISTQEYGSIGTVTIWGKKGTAGTIDKGCPVYITGFDDDIHQVELANASTATTMPVIGFTGEDFDNTTTNPIITFGRITGLDTTITVSTLNPNGETWAVNDVLYMNTTDGGLTKNRPTGTNTQIQRIAKVLKVNASSGQLFIFNTARTSGLPNLTTDYVWLGNGNDTPQEVIKTDLGVSVTGFSYDNNNTFTITDDNSGSITSTFNQVSGLTINGDLDVTGDTTLNTLTATSVTSNSEINVFNGHINLRDNSYFLQGRTVADANVSLIGVDNQDRVFVGNAGYDTYIDSDTIVDGSLTATTLNIGTIGGTTSITNLGIDASGNVVSGTTGGGGTSYWEETTSTIKLDTGETTRDVVEINTGGANTLSGTYSLGNLLVGDGNTFGNGQTVRRSFIGGNAVAVGASEAFQTSIVFGQTITVEGTSTSVFGASHVVKGNYNFTAGQNNDLYGDNLTAIGTNNILGTSSVNINRSIVIGEDADSYADDQIVIGFGIGTNASWGAAKAIYVGIEDSRASSGWFSDPTIGSGTNFALGGNNTMRTDVGVIKAGAGRGILYLNNYTGSSVSEPTVDISDSVGLWAKNRDTGVTGLIVKAENGGKTWIGDRIGINTVTPTEALDVSGNTVMSGTLNIGTVNTGTPVKNLAVDSSGNVVEASDSVSDQNKIFSWFMNVS